MVNACLALLQCLHGAGVPTQHLDAVSRQEQVEIYWHRPWTTELMVKFAHCVKPEVEYDCKFGRDAQKPNVDLKIDDTIAP